MFNILYIYIYIYIYNIYIYRLKFIYISLNVKLICSGIYIFLTRILKSLAKQQEAYLIHQTGERGKGTNLASSLEHFAAKWYLYGSLRFTMLSKSTSLTKPTSAGPTDSQTRS